MDAVFFIKKERYENIKNMLLSDDMVSRQSLDFRDNKVLGMENEGYYLKISGSKESIEKARKIIGSSGKELIGKEKELILKKINEQENDAVAGFGNIFG
ncbi:MAG TPA: hypothetical protein ENG42_01975 [Candidatus Aenigmarchaeota archaeon]|nr:MAG: hypothetical protein DRP03_03505 [Candidatus Aenigmarchaeota archaeon]HDD46216.1 hypothetical protein [Candidatus Aenigmarchaeota archaeon]